ncbi:MAG TPA: methyltransferase domain-containing protein [Methanobacterium subterraneum]|uniref:Methyltransferase domain-containing protein n=1 Tax=Methanobacterium subterraneum TaxID=59277 RepID=A0A7J4TKJ2_9EURY|nr:methyltransferase domain-containing protein [Methanobacterium subterraneum]
MQTEKHVHKHHGKSTRDILDPKIVLSALGLKQGQTLMDAGCGDGHISLAASSLVGNEGKIFSLDVYQPSLDQLKAEIKKEGINNISPILADMTVMIPLDDESVDKCVMANVLHGFAAEGTLDSPLSEINRVLRPGGTFAVVEFIKVVGPPGPSYDVRLTPENVEKILLEYGFKIGGTAEVGKYHYLVESFKK